jgi:protocatechuate 3,4-dioxygenase beta subunit
MRQVTEDDITAQVLERFGGTPDPRLRQVMQSLVKHLHAFVRDVELTEAEWFAAIKFLNWTGRLSVNGREEFILLSDTLGVSMLVDLINHRKPVGATESTVVGPFYVENSPELPYGGNIAWKDDGMPTFVYGRVLDIDRSPIPNAELAVWQTGSDALYDIQKPDHEHEEAHMRGRFRTDAQGRYLVRTVKPVSYPIPDDGAVGAMMRATHCPYYRPAHIHFMISSPGCETLTTHLFDSTDDCLNRDPVYGVKESLVCDFTKHDTRNGTFDVAPPYLTLEYDFVMKPIEGRHVHSPWHGATAEVSRK